MNLSRLVLTGGSTLALCAAASAAPITWGGAQNTTGFADVSVNGTVVQAVNLSPQSGSTTVNGVTFQNSDAFLDNSTNQAFLGTPAATTGNADYDALLNRLDFGNGPSFTLSLGDGLLSVGGFYEVQLWFTDLRPNSAARIMTFGDGLGNNVDLGARGTAAAGSQFGQFAIGTFTADGINQDLFMATNWGGGNVHLTAFQIRELPAGNVVPSPGTMLLVGAALLALGAVRRRHA